MLASGVAVGLVYINYDIVAGKFPENKSVSMAFPFEEEGVYLIQEGSNSRFSNRHYDRSPVEQRYAIDITLMRKGMKQASLVTTTLEDFHIYGVDIVSPCDGLIQETMDGEIDNIPGVYNAESGVGNSILLRCGDFDVYLAHLKPGSVLVAPQQEVRVGDHLAKVGNSGFSTEPHLHLQASLSSTSNEMNGVPAPMIFNSRYLTNHDIVNIGAN